ncbi:cyclin-L2-like [Rhopalosiphum padi]|uniref:cyclin-L2-like n=1 Tax=Rhopalosiphum padi TaxID=40932 RepID=UPI00298D614C|nr:cyclin-L2-like [Rhopalosiphum padi]XP_060854760.1 cyclin-L2-like [Rhopalosiphum padi]XP_060854761.1 cyclin-L2-like [Rhopalosiphum padi]XP_060854762.1 cyclin-L2-like [Rhopalosiphum padi]XP_060854763.1 cyclin-L2-like [Rhopalosiphum padi]
MCKMETMTMTCTDMTHDSHLLKQPTKVLLTLSNVLLPKEKLTSTPSMIDGLDFETEVDLRIVGCEWIQTAGMLLKLPQVAMATGQVLFQRFYYTKSFVRYPMEITAMACTCLASKVEESPRRIRDVINVYHHIRQVLNQKLITPLVLDQNYVQKKTQVIKAERRVLKELGFCVHVKHPHKLIVMYLQALGFEKHQSIMQMSWNYMNDSLQTDVFVQFDPETIACACIYLSARKLKIPLPKSPAWYSLFNSNETDIQDICRKILKLYLRPKIITEVLEKRVEESKKEYDHAKEQAKEAIAHSVVQTEVITFNPSNGITAAIPKNISSITPNKKPIKKRSRTPLKTKSRSKSPRHLKKSKKRKLVPTYRNYKDYKDYKNYRGNENFKSKSRNYNYRKKY